MEWTRGVPLNRGTDPGDACAACAIPFECITGDDMPFATRVAKCVFHREFTPGKCIASGEMRLSCEVFTLSCRCTCTDNGNVMVPGREPSHAKAPALVQPVVGRDVPLRQGEVIEKANQPVARGSGRLVLGNRGTRVVRAPGAVRLAATHVQESWRQRPDRR